MTMKRKQTKTSQQLKLTIQYIFKCYRPQLSYQRYNIYRVAMSSLAIEALHLVILNHVLPCAGDFPGRPALF